MEHSFIEDLVAQIKAAEKFPDKKINLEDVKSLIAAYIQSVDNFVDMKSSRDNWRKTSIERLTQIFDLARKNRALEAKVADLSREISDLISAKNTQSKEQRSEKEGNVHPSNKLSPEKADLLRNPTIEKAKKFWPYHILGEPSSDDVVLAGIHKARVLWEESTREMIDESIEWLKSHGFKTPSENLKNIVSAMRVM